MSKLKLFGILLASLLVVGMFFLEAIVYTIIGAFVGWVLSLFFAGDWVIQGFAIFNIDVSGKLIQLGAMLGFVSGIVSGIFNKTIKIKNEETSKE